MAEICTEGYAVSVNPGGSSEFDREVVAVFRDEIIAQEFAAYTYGNKWLEFKPEINHVFWGIEAF